MKMRWRWSERSERAGRLKGLKRRRREKKKKEKWRGRRRTSDGTVACFDSSVQMSSGSDGGTYMGRRTWVGTSQERRMEGILWSCT